MSRASTLQSTSVKSTQQTDQKSFCGIYVKAILVL